MGKWFELSREIAPGLTRVGVIYNPDYRAIRCPVDPVSAKAAAGS